MPGNDFIFCDYMYDTNGKVKSGVKSHGAHMLCLKLEEEPTEWLCQTNDCLTLRSQSDTRTAQTFFVISDNGKSATFQGRTWKLKKGVFSGFGSGNGYPLAAAKYKLQQREVFGPCCFATPNFYECEHIRSVFPSEEKAKEWRESAKVTWGSSFIFNFKDILVKIPPVGEKIFANKFIKARALREWKANIMDFCEEQEMFETYTIVDTLLEYGTLLETTAKEQYNSLTKNLRNNSFFGMSKALNKCKNEVQEAILGISRYLADPEKFSFAAVRLMKWPAKYQVGTHVDGSPYDNPTALLLEGTALLMVVEDQKVIEHTMFFGESRENGYNDPHIELKKVYLGKKPHSAIAGEHTCLWFSVNFLKRNVR